MLTNASGQTLADRSRVLNGRSPTVWQIELIDQVAWCRTAMRTRLPQKNAVSAPLHDCAHSPPKRGQAQRQRDPQREQPRDPHDVAVGEQVRREALLVGLLEIEQPADVRVPQPSAQGTEVRAVAPRGVRVALPVAVRVVATVVATQRTTGPSTARLPATASAMRVPRPVLNEPCVK